MTGPLGVNGSIPRDWFRPLPVRSTHVSPHVGCPSCEPCRPSLGTLQVQQGACYSKVTLSSPSPAEQICMRKLSEKGFPLPSHVLWRCPWARYRTAVRGDNRAAGRRLDGAATASQCVKVQVCSEIPGRLTSLCSVQ